VDREPSLGDGYALDFNEGEVLRERQPIQGQVAGGDTVTIADAYLKSGHGCSRAQAGSRGSSWREEKLNRERKTMGVGEEGGRRVE
jgi:hypothetical protein